LPQEPYGVPLFVEEMTKAVLESGGLRESVDAYHLAGPLNALAIPTTLHDSLMARLDRLQPVKEVAQIAAVIGRSFDHRTIAPWSPCRRQNSSRRCTVWSRPS
jgi:predicted ATPase